jgi:hypothetical protein
VIPQAVSPLRFEIKPAVLAVHEKALVVVEQLEGSHVNARGLVASAMLAVPVGELRGRYALRLTALPDQRVESVRTGGRPRVYVARDGEKAVVSLMDRTPGPGMGRRRVDDARDTLLRQLIDEHYFKPECLSPEAIYREAGYRCQARTAASRWESPMGRFCQILLPCSREQA